MAKATRTISPLHFEDLEPHRFEDLVRQLVYDFRTWSSIEAVGRLGSDQGIDIRATERITFAETILEEDVDEGEEQFIKSAMPQDRIWIIQCKRERRIGPTKIEKIVSSNLSRQDETPYGYILAAACDFSKAARDAFRKVVVAYGIEEFYLLGKAELEDMLFLPRNDHLLFAYFGISLQVRRRSMKTELRSKLTLKRKLIKELGEISKRHYKVVLIRDPRDTSYPLIDVVEDFAESPRWRYWQVYGHIPIDHIAFITRRCFAYVDWSSEQWDALLDHDDGWPSYPNLYGMPDNWHWHRDRDKRQRYHRFWDEQVPKANRAWYNEIRIIPYERILAVDEIGDAVNEGPHLLVEYRQNGDPFEDGVFLRLIEAASGYSGRVVKALEESRVEYFPREMPELEIENLERS
jgi:hypothetical protein